MKNIANIARIWHGRVPREKSDEYLHLMRTVALPDYRATPGNAGAYLLHRMEGEVAHFLTLSFWDSETSVSAFAGDPVENAKYYDFDRDYLLELEPTVIHYRAYVD
jgi:heme-degrading monooxygenase HmoA